MNPKMKLSFTVMMLLGFILVLFYQNCAPEGSEDLGGASTFGGSGNNNGDDGNGGLNAACTKISSGNRYIYDVRVPNTENDSLFCLDTNMGNATCHLLPRDTVIPNNNANNCPTATVPTCADAGENFPDEDCPVVSCSANADYINRFGVRDSNGNVINMWIRRDCPCVAGQGFQYSSQIGGTINPEWNITYYFLNVNLNSGILTFKSNTNNPNNVLRSVTCSRDN